MKRALLISYYWPPTGGGGVQRWLKMSKYFRENGWELSVYTPDLEVPPVEDKSLLKEVREDIQVVKQPIWEPYDLYRKFTGKKKGEKVYSGFITEGKKAGFAQKAAVWIRGNVFIPDARMFWIKPSVRFLKSWLKDNAVDAVISTGPPNSMHLIGLGVKEATGLPWVADFRDPWTNIDFYRDLHLNPISDAIHRRLEKKVLRKADKVVTVSWSWGKDFEAILPREVDIITNGYDPADFEGEAVQLDEKFSICHLGSMNRDRNPQSLWEVCAELKKEDPEFAKALEFKLIGNVDFANLADMETLGLSENLNKIDFIPHDEAILECRKSRVLLLPINRTFNFGGVLPGKLYEYMASGRPMLCIGDFSGDIARIIEGTKCGLMADFDDKEKLRRHILDLYADFKSGSNRIKAVDTERYSRRSLAADYTKLLDSISS